MILILILLVVCLIVHGATGLLARHRPIAPHRRFRLAAGYGTTHAYRDASARRHFAECPVLNTTPLYQMQISLPALLLRRVESSDVAEGCVCHHCAAQLRDIGGPYSPHSSLGDAVQQAFLRCFQRITAALRHGWSVWLPTDEQEALRNVPLCWFMRLSHHLILFAGTWLYEAAFSSLPLRNFSMQQPAILNIHCGAF